MANQHYQDWAVEKGVLDAPQPTIFNLYLEPLRKFQLAAEGHGDVQPPEHLRQRVLECFTPLPTWYPPFEGAGIDLGDYPYHAITQRPAAMYHSWGSQNAWLRQIHGENPMYVPGPICDEVGLVDGDWAWIRSYHGEICVPVQRMNAVNEKTLWTWNAIGKRKGAWNLSANAPESKRGFLLNHLINELLPPKGDGQRYANSDPITGQAAWYDLRVSIEKAEQPPARSLPEFTAQKNPVPAAPTNVEYGKEWQK
jgi:anaerobic selenocysteine-containing dehydrogenase